MGNEYENQQEREVYKKRLQKQGDAIENLLKIAENHTRLFSNDMLRTLGDRKAECERLYRKLDKNEFEIAIVGLEKAGKSTFANALIGNRVLPDADERCTYTATCIKYGPIDRAKVSFFTQAEFDRNLRDKLADMGIEKTEQYSVETLSLSEYEGMYSRLDEKSRKFYETNINEDVKNILKNRRELLNSYLGKGELSFEGDQLRTDDFKKYIISPNVAIAVKEVSIESAKLKDMDNAIIYDVPGFDSPTQLHEDQTVDKMKKADVIILIASAEKPSFTAPALNVFNKVVDDDNVELSDKLFIFGNRADAANTLEKNIDTLKSEAKKWKLLSENHLQDRIFIGSAKAHLQSLKQEEGDYCIKKIEDESYKKIVSYGDGIEHTYDKLIEYNNTDRFRILKRKVNQNDQEIRKVFKQLQEEYGEGANAEVNIVELVQSNDKLHRESQNFLIKELEKLREEIRDSYNNDHVLSGRMKEKIEELFQSDKYTITEEDIIAAKRKIPGSTSSKNVEKVEELIRVQKFDEIYNDFSDIVSKIAIEDHKQSYDKIVDLFECALHVNRNSSDYESIKELIRTYIQAYKKADESDDSYQTLIERFVRDLVEILIMRPYGMEARLNRFLDDSSIFTGLIMFYDPGDNTTNYKKNFMAIAPKDQPLLYALLFHEYKDAVKASRDMFSYINSMLGGIAMSTRVYELLWSIIKRNPGEALNILKGSVTKQDFYKSDKAGIVDELIRRLMSLIRKISKGENENKIESLEDYDFTDEETFKNQYTTHFAGRGIREYEDIQKEYDVDLQILEELLVSASIPAISIEKPFVDKEVKSIEALINSLRSEQYSNFISKNMKLLVKDSYDEYNRKISERMLNQMVVREIDNVLKNMSDNE